MGTDLLFGWKGARAQWILRVAILAAGAALGAACGSKGTSQGQTGTSTGGHASSSSSSGSTGGDAGSGGGGAGGDAGTCGWPPSILKDFVAKRTLYVAPGGNDGNDGLTAATAWATLGHASSLQPGDEVKVAAGTYGCPNLTMVAGTAAAPIHLVAAGAPLSAVMDCGGNGELWLQNVQYLAIDGFEIRNSGAGAHCVQLISGSGPPYLNLSEHVLFINDYIHNCGMSAIKSSQTFEVEVRSTELADNMVSDPLIDYVGCHDMRVLGSHIHDSTFSGVQVKGGAYDCLIDGNVIHDTVDTAIQLGEATGITFFLPGYTDWEAKGSIASNNVLYGGMRAAVTMQGCDGCVVAHNSMWGSNAAFFIRSLSGTNGNADGGTTGQPIDTINLTLLDNIFAAQTLPIPINATSAADAVGLDQGYNLYFSTAGTIAGHYSDIPIGGTGNLVDMDPKFVSEMTPDLHLAPGSPAIGAATPVPGVPDDFSGACRTDNDLGAY